MATDNISRKNFLKTSSVLAGASLFSGPFILKGGCTPASRQSDLILAENSKEGSTDWLITKVARYDDETGEEGWEVREEIQGFASHLSIESGETLNVYVSAKPADEYDLDIYRMGYYGGAGGRLVESFKSLKGTPQPVPEDGLRNIIDCDWEEALSIEIPDDWLSGVYLGKLSTHHTDGEAYIIFIVRDDRQADLLFQCSDFTWISYNRWPQRRSLYDAPGTLWGPGRPDSYDAGFNRPYGIFYNRLPADFQPITNGSGEFLLWELPLAFWLEKEGYDVTYISNLDAHRNLLGLLRGKVFLSVGHDEYWTQEQFDNVRRARDAGLNLAFFSGNSVSGRIELLSDRTGRPYRGMHLINRNLEEIELMGARSYGVGFGDWISKNTDHWIYEGTGLSEGEKINQLVGWEYHGPPLADYHNEFKVLAQGPVTRGGNVIENRSHAATIYTAEKGNYVFNAGTCWWNMPLSSPPGFVNPPNHDYSENDARVQRITKNVLNRMIATDVKYKEK
jgi:hypothetical protein